ncbi:MAG: sensor histidine kinase [Rickettsiales bacterium]
MLNTRTQPSLSRDFALLSLFIVFILIMVSVWVAFETYSTYEKDVVKQMESEALRLDRGLIVEIENASYILESVGRQIQATNDDAENIAQLFFSFAKVEGPKRAIFSWVNKEQMITVSNNLGVIDKPIDVSDRDYVKKAIAEPWKVHIGRPIEGRLSHTWILPLSLGLTDKNGTFLGSVIVALDTESLGNDISRTIKDSGIRFAITNLSLTLLTQSPTAEKFFNENFDLNRLEKIDFDKNPSGSYSVASLFKDSQIYSYYERSSQYPYIIFLGLDSKKSAQELRKLLVPRLFQLLVIAVFLLFVLWTVRKRIIHPVIALTEQTATIVRGEHYDADHTRGPLEIEQLAAEIKRLYDYIEERRRIEAELRLKNAELTRVKEAAQVTNQVKADFFAYVGQELTEPTETILQQIETLKDQHFGPIGNPKYLAHAIDIDEQARQLMAMLEDIKSISKAETGLLSLNESDIDLAFVLQKTIRIFRDKQAPGTEVQLDTATRLPHIRGDELRVKQLILNILNSIGQQLTPGDPIRITSSLKAQELSLSLSYPSNPSLASASRSKQGLDLALARLLVALHQGTLEMKTTQDRITVITVKFPALRVL